MYIYIYKHVHIYSHTHEHTDTFTQIHMHIAMQTCIQTITHVHSKLIFSVLLIMWGFSLLVLQNSGKVVTLKNKSLY